MATLHADGINGVTLLGFLAAVGSLRLLAERHADARLWFDPDGDRARLSAGALESAEALVDCIVERYFADDRVAELALLRTADAPKTVRNRDDGSGALSVQELAERAADDPASSPYLFVSSLLCDGLAKDTKKAAETNGKDEAAETVLCAANRGSHQKMFVTMRDLRNLVVEQSEIADAEPKLVTASHLRRTLTELWRFDDIAPKAVTAWLRDRKPTLRWDEGAERLHALRLHDPTKDPDPFSTQFGGYSLAASALPCFQTFPDKRGALTSFSLREKNAKEVTFFWPLWDTPATLATTQAMHLSGEAQRDPTSARARGVYRLMRATRQTQEKGKLTFQSAEALW